METVEAIVPNELLILALIIGLIAILLTAIGRIRVLDIVVINPTKQFRLVLGVFGLMLMVLAFFGILLDGYYFFAITTPCIIVLGGLLVSVGIVVALSLQRAEKETLLSIIEKAQISTAHSLPPESGGGLLDSLRRQEATLVKNLGRLEETRAKYGLSVPLNILNAIDQTQEDLKQVRANIADLEAREAETI